MTDRTELRRLLDEATPRPWEAEVGFAAIYGVGPTGLADFGTMDDARLVAAAVNALPDLLDQLDAAELAAADAILYESDCRDALARQTPFYLAAKTGVERVRELHAPYYPLRSGRACCGACEGDEFVHYPCPTIRALDGGADS